MDVQRTIAALQKRGFAVRYFETAVEAADYLAESIAGKTVGIGGSMTIEQMGLYERLCARNTVYWHWRTNDLETRVLAAGAEVYLTSANAIAETGEIVNIDGAGNRVAATLFNHERVVFVAGVNKIAADYERALFRARNVASPLNARRLGMKTPCAAGGEIRCYDCASADRICCGVVTMIWPMRSVGVTEVVLVREGLGY
jgi:L-lactate utilization protein LutB